MKPTPFLLTRCALQGCDRQSHFTLDDGRTICDKHALLFGTGAKRVAAFNEEEAKKQPDFEVQSGLEGLTWDDSTTD